MRRYLPLILIVLLAALLRFSLLDIIPPSLSWDETAIGYNAWSILKTGRDEYGATLPISFRSFDDYKQPVIFYLTALSEAVLGLNEWAVRFPSAFLGTLTVLCLYLLVKELFAGKKEVNLLALVTAFLLAINPWHINFSRGAFETNISLFFFVAGLLFLFKALKKPILFLAAAVLLILSLYSYYTTRLAIPFILFAFAFTYRKELWLNKKWVIIGAVLGGFLLLPLVKETLFDQGLARAGYVSIFTHQKGLAEEYSREILRHDNSLVTRIFYNRRLAYFLIFADNYLKSFSPDFLFINGVEMSGLFYLWEAFFLPLGLVKLLERKEKWKWVLLTWLLAVPLAGGLSIGAPNAFRNLPNVGVMTIFSGYGLTITLEKLRKKSYFKMSLLIGGVIVVFSFFHFLLMYFDYTPIRKAPDLGDGYKQLTQVLNQKKNNYDRIWVTGEYWRPYIHLLFHLKYNPALYQQGGEPAGFDVFRFGKAEWDPEGIDLGEAKLTDLVEGKTLFVLSKNDYENQKGKIENFSFSLSVDGRFNQAVFWLIELFDSSRKPPETSEG